MNLIEDRLEQALDNGLRMTFPASDPVAVSAASKALRLQASGGDWNARATGYEPQKEMNRRGAPSP
jgi:hypothetical protein